MRVELRTPPVVTAPGAPFELVLEVFNTSGVIDGITARPVGLDPSWVRTDPARLALFPDTSDLLTVEVTLPAGYPAGHHDLAIEVASSADPSDVEYVSCLVEVRPSADVVLQLEPARMEGRRRGRLLAVALNAGNTPVEVVFTASDRERALRYAVIPQVVSLPAQGTAEARVAIRTRRRWFGSPVEVPFDVTASTRELEVSAPGTFVHTPLIPRGALTAAMLVGIVAAWAAIFLLIFSQILGGDDPDKVAPPSYFATSAEALEAGAGPGAGAGAGGAGADGGAAAGKLDLADVGASITGTVRATSTGSGVGRITVEAIRITRRGPQLTSSAATDDEGFYSVSGVPPGTYAIHFVNPGFEELWYPSAPTREAGDTIRVGAKEERTEIDAVVTGLPGSLSGIIETGVEPGRVVASVIVRPLVGGVPGQPVATRTTNDAGAFSVVGLETPLTYEITANAPGYQSTTTVEEVAGGEQRIASSIRLSAGPGSISGTVLSGGSPLGGVTITASAGELEVTSATPTSGAVGRYALADLPTPGTYLLTFSREGFGSETLAVELGPGENRTGLDITLASGTGSISGTVRDPAQVPLGDVEVTVNGGTTSVTTRTLTAGARGSWSVNGLTPGEYTITFSLPRYSDETIAVTLPSFGAVRGADAQLAVRLASLRGTVSSSVTMAGLANVEIVITDGTTINTATSASSPAGTYIVTDLVPGLYSVTYTATGFQQRTMLVELFPGESVTEDVALVPGA